ncbi:unnamed protein product, partial [Aureobasidium pullulans]
RVTISRNARRLQNKIRELETITPLLLHVQIRTPFVFTRWATQLHSKTYGLLYTTPRLYDTQQEAMYALLLWAYGLLSEDATWGSELIVSRDFSTMTYCSRETLHGQAPYY